MACETLITFLKRAISSFIVTLEWRAKGTAFAILAMFSPISYFLPFASCFLLQYDWQYLGQYQKVFGNSIWLSVTTCHQSFSDLGAMKVLILSYNTQNLCWSRSGRKKNNFSGATPIILAAIGGHLPLVKVSLNKIIRSLGANWALIFVVYSTWVRKYKLRNCLYEK